jgi:hypothetical protein
LLPSTPGPVKTVRANAGGAEPAPDDGIVYPDAENVYEQVLMFWDKVGAAYAGAHERVASQVDEYQASLASAADCLARATSAHVDFVTAVASAQADLTREIAEAWASALRDILRTRD